VLRSEIVRVGALVGVVGEAPVAPLFSVEGQTDPRRLAVEVTAFAETTEGERIAPERPHNVTGFWRRGRGAIWKRYSGRPLPSDPVEEEAVLEQYRLQRQDVEDAINQMFGRDPEQDEVPQSAGWKELIKAVGEKGLDVTLEELKAAPFICEFSPGLMSQLG
jgi:hypothetical protein